MRQKSQRAVRILTYRDHGKTAAPQFLLRNTGKQQAILLTQPGSDILKGTQVSDLSPLKGMSLKNLGLRDTPVENLKPLQGMPLNALNLLRTKVKDLSPLKGAPLTWLTIIDSGVTDLTPLEGMPLEKILFHPERITKGMDVIRNLKSLREIGWGKGDLWKPDEFWRKYEAGEFKQQDHKKDTI